MRKSPPFTRILAAALAVMMLKASAAEAVSPAPGSLAVLEPPMSAPEVRAAWDGVRSGIYLDPLLLVRGREEVQKELEVWRQTAESVRSAIRTADRITLDRAQSLLEEAWVFYFQFDYGRATGVLGESKNLLLSTPGDSGFRTQLMFELLLLSGIVARASGDESYINDFKGAAALDPHRELSNEKYSPENITIYRRVRNDLLKGGQVPFFIEGNPTDAVVVVDGEELAAESADTGHLILPGNHFIEVSAPGYEPWGLSLDAERFGPASLRFELVPIGPDGDPDTFFLERLKAGDRTFMALLAGKLDVDYMLVTDTDGGALRAWLIDRDGRTLDHASLWERGDDRGSAARKAAELIKPLRQEWALDQTTADAPFNLPAPEQAVPETLEGGTPWSRYALAIGILILAAAAAGADRGSGTRIEATW